MSLSARTPSKSHPASLRATSRGEIIGQDARLREVLETVDRVARSVCTVLVTGESGTGKELVVAALHDASPRSGAELVTINCGAIPSELVESELFGHAKGAFTGAQSARRGLVAAAEGGTLFLDEVGELPLPVQVKLLRLLQQREYTPVGENRAIKCDVRIVAATHRDLEAAVREGRFREDLYYRLNVIHVELPALRERPGDVVILAQHFFASLAERSGRADLRGLSPDALAAIAASPWPGNVRALENALERGVLLAKGPFVEADDIFGRGQKRALAPTLVPAAEADTAAPAVTGALEPDAAAFAGFAASVAAEAPADLELGALQKLHALPDVVMQEVAAPPEDPAVVAVPSDVAGGSVRRGSNPLFPRMLPDAGVQLFDAVTSYQNNLIRQALARTDGNRNRAAQLLGVNRTTLVEMIRRRKL